MLRHLSCFNFLTIQTSIVINALSLNLHTHLWLSWHKSFWDVQLGMLILVFSVLTCGSQTALQKGCARPISMLPLLFFFNTWKDRPEPLYQTWFSPKILCCLSTLLELTLASRVMVKTSLSPPGQVLPSKINPRDAILGEPCGKKKERISALCREETRIERRKSPQVSRAKALGPSHTRPQGSPDPWRTWILLIRERAL